MLSLLKFALSILLVGYGLSVILKIPLLKSFKVAALSGIVHAIFLFLFLFKAMPLFIDSPNRPPTDGEFVVMGLIAGIMHSLICLIILKMLFKVSVRGRVLHVFSLITLVALGEMFIHCISARKF